MEGSRLILWGHLGTRQTFSAAHSHELFMHQNALFKHVDGLCPSETFDLGIVLGKTLSRLKTGLVTSGKERFWIIMGIIWHLEVGSRDVHTGNQKGKKKSVFVTKGEAH